MVGPSIMDVEQAQRFFLGFARGIVRGTPALTNADAKQLADYWRDSLKKLEQFGIDERLPPGSPPVIGNKERALKGELFALEQLAAGATKKAKFPKPKDIFKAGRDVALSIARFAKIKPIPWRSPVIDAPIRRRGGGAAGVGLALAFAAGYYASKKG